MSERADVTVERADIVESAVTPEQARLFALMANFAVDTVLGWVGSVYKKFGPKVAAGDAFPGLIVPFAQEYFNFVAHLIYSREDGHVNEKFDEMASVRLENRNDPIDVLQNIVFLCLNLVGDMDIRDAVGDSYELSMLAVRAHLGALVRRRSGLASSLRGCGGDHVHVPVARGEKIFTFAVDKYAMTKDGPVKLSNLEL